MSTCASSARLRCTTQSPQSLVANLRATQSKLDSSCNIFVRGYQYGEQKRTVWLTVMAVPMCLQTKTPPARIQTFLEHCAPTFQYHGNIHCLCHVRIANTFFYVTVPACRFQLPVNNIAATFCHFVYSPFYAKNCCSGS
jgi:hypothetical protein